MKHVIYMELVELKKKYNECLKRNQKAEEYLMSHTIEECEKPLKIVYGKSFDTFDLFSEVAADLSKLIIEIEKNMGKKMTRYEILNGFKL